MPRASSNSAPRKLETTGARRRHKLPTVRRNPRTKPPHVGNYQINTHHKTSLVHTTQTWGGRARGLN
ncbi:unnamed protein product [Tuber melanosporum]|uniref:(Perigord truffle) hypothetical protein n=1 Tax=Tuber melanosporum (strain Mel28) TaxID=656061 RepID=D5GHN3_TUBMM|nr:uncharacterized protein GSTUM_00008057001 [Tuber melanosporum]CAZ84063.1 unnamed protein product [Tuber melanosporum]